MILRTCYRCFWEPLQTCAGLWGASATSRVGRNPSWIGRFWSACWLHGCRTWPCSVCMLAGWRGRLSFAGIAFWRWCPATPENTGQRHEYVCTVTAASVENTCDMLWAVVFILKSIFDIICTAFKPSSNTWSTFFVPWRLSQLLPSYLNANAKEWSLQTSLHAQKSTLMPLFTSYLYSGFNNSFANFNFKSTQTKIITRSLISKIKIY